MAAKQFLALLEVDKIQSYIFATNKLKEIRGASYLLSEINEATTAQVLKDYSTAKKKILSTGGVTKVIFDDENEAYKFLKQMEGIYQRELITASVTTHVEPISNDFYSAIGKGELAIRRRKEDKDYIFQINTSGYYKICSFCGQYPAKESKSTPEGILWLCASCKQKRANSRFLHIHDSIANKIKENQPMVNKVEFPEQFEKIGKESHIEGYMGYIVADGNRMGEKIKSKEVSSDTNRYHDFSKKVKECTDEALVEAVIESVPKIRERDNSLSLPVVVLILGGDDMILVTTAESALPLAAKFSQKFQQKTKEKNLPEISMSVGVVISKVTFPIFSYTMLGEELLKSAKRLSREMNKDGKEVGAIDFMVVTSPSTQSLEDVRKDSFYYKKKDTLERFLLTARPYTTTGSNYDYNLDKLLTFTRQFKNCDFPRTKLKAMERYLRMGRENSILEFCTMRLRLDKIHCKLLDDFVSTFKLHEQMPWRIENDNEGKYFLTNLLDLVEIYEFVQGGKQ
ncbi:CRISPR/Cas system-associated protein Cas10 [Methanophagales archaeon]|nr:CRISPR/Cas system-associated protein Cas10 [Methanophagales archaeon]